MGVDLTCGFVHGKLNLYIEICIVKIKWCVGLEQNSFYRIDLIEEKIYITIILFLLGFSFEIELLFSTKKI
jgi:hypothetical protein